MIDLTSPTLFVTAALLLLASSLAFTLVKFAGAAYLVWLGLRSLLQRDGGSTAGLQGSTRQGLGSIFWRGVVVNYLHPPSPPLLA